MSNWLFCGLCGIEKNEFEIRPNISKREIKSEIRETPVDLEVDYIFYKDNRYKNSLVKGVNSINNINQIRRNSNNTNHYNKELDTIAYDNFLPVSHPSFNPMKLFQQVCPEQCDNSDNEILENSTIKNSNEVHNVPNSKKILFGRKSNDEMSILENSAEKEPKSSRSRHIGKAKTNNSDWKEKRKKIKKVQKMKANYSGENYSAIIVNPHNTSNITTSSAGRYSHSFKEHFDISNFPRVNFISTKNMNVINNVMPMPFNFYNFPAQNNLVEHPTNESYMNFLTSLNTKSEIIPDFMKKSEIENVPKLNLHEDPFSCVECEEFYKNSILNDFSLKIMKCLYCNNVVNNNSHEYYKVKYSKQQEVIVPESITDCAELNNENILENIEPVRENTKSSVKYNKETIKEDSKEVSLSDSVNINEIFENLDRVQLEPIKVKEDVCDEFKTINTLKIKKPFKGKQTQTNGARNQSNLLTKESSKKLHSGMIHNSSSKNIVTTTSQNVSLRDRNKDHTKPEAKKTDIKKSNQIKPANTSRISTQLNKKAI